MTKDKSMASRKAPVTIGFLYSQVGVTSVLETAQRQGALLAAQEINAEGGLLGEELLIEDSNPQSNPLLFRSEATRLLNAGVDALFGCYMSSTRKAVLPVVEARHSLLFYPTFYEGFEYVEGCIYSGAAPNQNARILADYLVETYDPRYFFVGSNYIFPYESNRIMRDLLSNRNASVVDEMYIPLSCTRDDIDRVIARIRKAGPVTVFSGVVGQGAIDLCQAYDAAGFDRARYPIASLTFGEPESRAAGLDASVGNVKAAPYFSVLRTPANARFVAAYRERFGPDQPISAEVEAAYFQVRMFAEAVGRVESTRREDLLSALPTFSYEAPQGPVRIDAANHHTYLWPRVGVIDGKGEFGIVRETTGPEAPDPYLVEHDDPVGYAVLEAVGK